MKWIQKMISLIKAFFKGRETSPSSLPEYTFVDRLVDKNQVVTGVKIKTGNFAGMIFTSNPSVQFKEKPNGELEMKFDYVIQMPPENQDSLLDDASVQKVVGDIILDIIYKNLDKKDADRDVDFKRSSEGSGVREESKTTPKE